ncbi:MAG: substrate-binding domain-containing protein [Oscillospiraceae bacterium]
MKKTALALLCALLLALALTACGQDAAEPSSVPSAAPSEAAETPGAASGLVILYEADEDMINNYSLLAVNPDAPFVDADGNSVADVYINTEGAAALINWMLSAEGEAAAADYGYAEYGEYLFYLADGAPVSTAEIPQATDETRVIRMSTTTSVNDSGLLGDLLPMFEDEYGYEVEVTSAGTGKAIANAESGNATCCWCTWSQEEEFVAAGYSYVLPGFESERLTFLYNYFVLCGPPTTPPGSGDAPSVRDAFAAIAEGKYLRLPRRPVRDAPRRLAPLARELGITVDAASVSSTPTGTPTQRLDGRLCSPWPPRPELHPPTRPPS